MRPKGTEPADMRSRGDAAASWQRRAERQLNARLAETMRPHILLSTFSRVVLCGRCGHCHLFPSGRQVSHRIAGARPWQPWGLCPRSLRNCSTVPRATVCRHRTARRPRMRAAARHGNSRIRPWNPGMYWTPDLGQLHVAAGHRLGTQSAKIVKVFEFIPLNCAPGRIRTCAHGSGEGCCACP